MFMKLLIKYYLTIYSMRVASRRRSNAPQALIDLKASVLPKHGSIDSIETSLEIERKLIDSIVKKHYTKVSESEWDYLKRREIVNGLGPKWNKLLIFFWKLLADVIPETVWYAHDLSYYIWGDELDREKADNWLYRHLKERISLLENAWTLKKYLYNVFAIGAYLACYYAGWKHFKYLN